MIDVWQTWVRPREGQAWVWIGFWLAPKRKKLQTWDCARSKGEKKSFNLICNFLNLDNRKLAKWRIEKCSNSKTAQNQKWDRHSDLWVACDGKSVLAGG